MHLSENLRIRHGQVRILTVIYVAQAGAGIVAGVDYAVWLLYW